jgi:RNA polymerase sigma-70 factor (ECF subfamily)
MSGDSFPLNVPLARFATDSCEATTLFEELRKPLLRYLSGLGLPAEEAQDVAQDAFLSLHKHLAQRQLLSEAGGKTDPSKSPTQAKPAWVGHPDNIRSWLFRVAHNRARNCQQSYAQRMSEPLDPVFDTASREATPEQAVLAAEKFRRLDKAVRSLAAQERECLMLRAEGLRYREIGEVLGVPTSTVADVVERAIKKLAEKCNV